MKNLSNHRITKFIAAAALAGMSIVSAYADPLYPNYVTPVDSPIDTTTITSEHMGGSVSSKLNNFNNYLVAIQGQLDLNAVTGDTLRTPNLGGGVAVMPADFAAAVAAAVVASPSDAAGIVSAAAQYMPGKVKDILVAVATASPASAPAAVAAAAAAVPKKAADAATGAIKGLIASSTIGANNGQMDDAAAATVMAETRLYIEAVAKNAVVGAKGALPVSLGLDKKATTSSEQAVRAKEIAGKLMEAFLVDASTSNSALYLDDVGRGLIAGAAGLTVSGGWAKDVAVEAIGKFATGPMSVNTAVNVASFAMGALKSAKIDGTDNNGFDNVKAALASAVPSFTADIDAGAKVQKALRLQVLSPAHADADLITAYQTQLTTADYNHIQAFILGALQVKAGLAPSLVTASFTDANKPAGALFTADMKKAIVAGATTSNSGNVAKIVTNAIAAANGIDPADAVSAAIPAASNLFSGLATLAAIKNNGVLLTSGAAQGVLSAAITAASNAGYNTALPEVALFAAKGRKDIDGALITAAVNAAPTGWEESVAAAIVANNPKGTSATQAIQAAFDKSGTALQSSVRLAVQLATRAKLSPKTAYDDAIQSLRGATTAIGVDDSGSSMPRSVLVGVGATNANLAVPLLAAAMRLKAGGDTDVALRDYAVSLFKKNENNIQLAFETAQDVLAHPDNLFDVLDHKIFTNPKSAVEILSAAVAARPEYAHYAARAAVFRAPALVSKIATAAIQYADMRSNTNDDPAAVAAISAATVLGLQDASADPKIAAKQSALLTAAISGLIKGTLLFTNTNLTGGKDDKLGLQGNAANFNEATGSGTAITDVTAKRALGSAAVLTGAIAQLQTVGATTLNSLSIAALTAAGKAAKASGLALAQAGGAAAQALAKAAGLMAPNFADFALIASTLNSAGAAGGLTGLENAARVGAAQYDAGYYGAGAAGILNYAHHNGNNTPVTDISNF